MPITSGFDHVATLTTDLGGETHSLFFRDVDGMELEVCCPVSST